MGAQSNPISFAIRIPEQFFFVLAQLEGPPEKNFGFNGNFNGKMTNKINGQKSLFRGPKWFPKCLNGGFRGGICIEKWS